MTTQDEDHRQHRLSMDALEALELIDTDGPFASLDELRDRMRDEDEQPFTRERVQRAIDELLAANRIQQQPDGTFESNELADYATQSVGDEKLGARVCVITRIYTADPDMALGVTVGSARRVMPWTPC